MPRDNVFSSCYTVADYESRIARNGHPYKRLVLENAFENIPANCWSGSYIGPESFNIGDIVRISARRKTLDFRELCDIQHATLIEPCGDDALISIRRSKVPCHNDLTQLIKIARGIGNVPLRNFVFDAFSNRRFALAFISIPASQRHHHNQAGGLLRHCLECVATVQDCVRQKEHRDIVTVAALFHDAAKVLTMQSDRKTPLGYMVDHDSLTLECLSIPLSRLDNSWPDAAIALRHIWTCKSQRHWGFSARTYLADVVQLADRISAGAHAEKQAGTSKNRFIYEIMHTKHGGFLR